MNESEALPTLTPLPESASFLVTPGAAPVAITSITVLPMTLRDLRAPVGVLIDEFTGSSAEAVALAFKGLPDTRFLGACTTGYRDE